jgi:hypothetical protein
MLPRMKRGVIEVTYLLIAKRTLLVAAFSDAVLPLYFQHGLVRVE